MCVDQYYRHIRTAQWRSGTMVTELRWPQVADYSSASNAEPCQPTRKIAGREVDLQNSSVSRITSRLGAVKDRRRVEPDISGIGEANDGPAPLNDRLQFAFRNLP